MTIRDLAFAMVLGLGVSCSRPTYEPLRVDSPDKRWQVFAIVEIAGWLDDGSTGLYAIDRHRWFCRTRKLFVLDGEQEVSVRWSTDAEIEIEVDHLSFQKPIRMPRGLKVVVSARGNPPMFRSMGDW